MHKTLKITALLIACIFSGIYLGAQESDQQNRNRTVTVNVEETNGKKETKVQITENGIATDYSWTGEMPENIREEFERMNIQVFSTSDDKHGFFISDRDTDNPEEIEVIIKKEDLSDGHIWINADDLHEKLENDIIEMESDGFKMKSVTVKVDEDGKNVYIIKKDGDIDTVQTDFNFEHASDGDLHVHVNVDASDENQAFLGVVLEQNITETIENDVEEKSFEVKVGDVVSGSGAEKAGILKGDLILEIEGQKITEDHSVIDALSPFSPEDEVELKISRNGTVKTIKAILGGRPEHHNSTTKHVIIKTMRSDDASDDVEIKGSFSPERTLELKDFEAFPNPSDGRLRLRFRSEATPLTVKLTDLNGKELYKRSMENFDGRLDDEIDLTVFPKGTLLLLIEQQGKIFSEKVVHQ